MIGIEEIKLIIDAFNGATESATKILIFYFSYKAAIVVLWVLVVLILIYASYKLLLRIINQDRNEKHLRDIRNLLGIGYGWYTEDDNTKVINKLTSLIKKEEVENGK